MPRTKPRAIVDIKSLAREQTQKAIDVLTAVMMQPKTAPAARVAAAQALLDRGWGRPAQVVTGDESGVPISVIHRVIVSLPAADKPAIDDVWIEGESSHGNDETATRIATHDDNGTVEANDTNELDGEAS